MKTVLYIFSFFLFCSPLTAQDDLTDYSFEALDSLYLLYNGVDFQEALRYAQAGADKAKKLYGKQDTTYAVKLINLGMQHYYLGAYTTTVDYWTEAMHIFETAWGVEHREYLSILGNIGLLHYYLGNYKESEKLTLLARKIKEKVLGKNHEDYAATLNNLGLVYWSTGRYEEAEGIYLEAKTILANTVGKEEMQYANTISNLASLYYDMGRKEEVEPLYLQTKEIFANLLGVEHPNYASIITNLAALYESMGETYQAELLYLEATEIRARVLGKLHPDYAGGIRNLAVLYSNSKRPKEALDFFLEAKKILLQVLDQEHPEYLSLLGNLGSFYIQIGENEKARATCLEAKNTIEKVLGKSDLKYFDILDKLSTLYIQTGETEKAWAVCFEHIESNSQQSSISRKIDQEWEKQLLEFDYISDKDMSSILGSIYLLLNQEKTLENIKKQQIVSQLAIDLLEKNRQDYLGEEDKLRLLSESAVWTHNVIKALAALDNNCAPCKKEAFKYAELNKSVLLANAIQTERAYSFGGLPDTLIFKEKELQESKAELKAALLEELPAEEHQTLQKELGEVNIELSNLKDKIEKEYPKYSQLKYEQKVVSLEELQPLLDEQTAIVEYVVSDSLLHIFYVDQHDFRMETKAISKKELTRNIKKLHGSLSDYNFIVAEEELAYRTYTHHAHWLYHNLLETILSPKKSPITQLVIVTDGELGHLPFETFLVEMAPQQENYKALHYLIQDYSISYDYSATLWKENLKRGQKQGRHEMLALAANYSNNDSTLFDHLLPTYKKLRKNLEPLPNAQQEVSMLSDLFEGNFLWGMDVHEHFFKNNASDYSIIHLAMHGVLNHDSPILSGLAFTENGDSTENNFLQAYEISQMDLNAALIVLSACETGYGEFEEGNGIASLARSFMYAGVPSMVVSLWQVNDQSTEIIMNGFYTNLKDGMNKAEALRQAKLDYLDRAKGVGAHPAFWSPFVQIGARAPVQLTARYGWGYYILGGIVLLILGLGFRRFAS